jgi:beta-lactam-binding protein with PASTA domain
MPFRRRRVVREEVLEAPLPPPRPNPWPWLLLLGLAVAGAVVGLWLWQDSEEQEPAATRTVVHTVETAPAGTTTLEIQEPEDVVGLTHAGAGKVLEAAGYRTDSYPVESAEDRGTVVSSSIDGDTARINVSLGDGPRGQLDVPDVTGPKESDARAAARAAGFTVRTVDRDAPSEEEVGEVILQEPAAGSSAPELAQITIYVGR